MVRDKGDSWRLEIGSMLMPRQGGRNMHCVTVTGIRKLNEPTYTPPSPSEETAN